uniref:Protein VAC14 homolog n=1 Tax=Panagrellus redivivus TaxID=6233 RepID=A0A7E4VTQ9_PANRE
MSDSQYGPLSQAVVRTLTDKLYEKRKSAALEIERQVRDLLRHQHLAELDRLITVLEGLTVTPNGHNRKGGLIGLAAVAIALGKENCPPYAGKLITPVLTCFDDGDQRVRYYACESLYNIVKICRTASLEHFDVLFDKFWKLASDPDQNVRSGAELLDRLMKEIVAATPTFDLEQLMVLIRERIHTINSSNRKFIISWFHTILKIPDFTVTVYIPEVIDGLFKTLDDPAAVVRETTTAVLVELLHKLAPKEKETVDLGAIINILDHHVAGSSVAARKMALEWMDQILKNYNTAMLPNISAFLVAILPWLYDDTLKAGEINGRLMALVGSDAKIDLDPVVAVLLNYIDHERRETRKAVLRWIRHLHANQPAEMYKKIDLLFPKLVSILCDQADDVLELAIICITDICGQAQQDIDIEGFKLKKEINEELRNVRPYLIQFTINLLQKFRYDSNLLNGRGSSIIRQICLLLDPRDVYYSLATLLPEFDSFATPESSTPTTPPSTSSDLSVDDFIAKMVGILNGILLTAPEMLQLRQKLKNPEDTNHNDLFVCLYRCWSHQPICLMSLCLLSKFYDHAAKLVPRLSEIDVSVQLLTEIDRLVQLIESPILSFVRLDLLDAEYQKPLAAVLSALLMLVPQTDAFNTLLKRLQAIPMLTISAHPHGEHKQSSIDFEKLLAHFDHVTQARIEKSRLNHRKLLDELVANRI